MHRRHFLITLPAALSASTIAAEKKWRVAVIGHTGRGNYGHGLDTMWLRLAETEIVAVADADDAGRAAAVKRLGLKAGHADYRQMLREVRPEIVAICPRHIDQHHEMALACAEAGVRGVYMEKPYCRTPQEADEIVTACEKAGMKLALAHRNRQHPVLPVVAKLIQDGLIGRVLEMRGRGKEDKRGGALDLWVLGSHVLNIGTYLGGAALGCSAEVRLKGRPITGADVREGDEGIGPLAGDEVHARYRLSSGITLYFDSIQEAGVSEAAFGLQVIGTQGIVDLRMDKEPLAHWLPGNPFQPVAMARLWQPITSAGVGKPEPIADLGRKISSHEVAGRDLIAAIQEGRAPLCDATQGRMTVEMISAVFESHRMGSAEVRLPLETRVNPLTRL
ncbi:MAG: Gfo/Idh/MocA family oxidoreductase [Prosthecobacter sp.]|jgi:predicted dehydrogenase|nr:Gfo/Idh/MocA family oxidoreductase [Prosthecobacter sp.]